MKLHLFFCLALGTSLLTGCATKDSTASSAPAAAQHGSGAVDQPTGTRKDGQPGAWNRTPEIGMTKNAVRERYGDPHKVEVVNGKEVWHYGAKVRGQDYIPVYGGFTRQFRGGTITFDSTDLVCDRSWGQRRWGY